MAVLKQAGAGIGTIGAWESAKGMQRDGGGRGNAPAARKIRPIGKNGRELGIPSTVAEKAGIPALALRDGGWMPASTEERARIEREMEAAIDGIIEAHRKNSHAMSDDQKARVIGIVLEYIRGSGDSHSC